ncbi:hypothetical protein [Micromonospora sp. CPCC 206061]|uniref:hypothetical protein n=1 Tax=Micromonospora sp. CPCC 206061 TaxID=3122410 RepID=UPI002FF22A5F
MHTVALGVTDPTTIQAAARQVEERFETNVFGVIAVTNAMLPLLRRSPAPRIVNASSHAASLTLTSDPDGPFAALLPDSSAKKARCSGDGRPAGPRAVSHHRWRDRPASVGPAETPPRDCPVLIHSQTDRGTAAGESAHRNAVDHAQ